MAEQSTKRKRATKKTKTKKGPLAASAAEVEVHSVAARSELRSQLADDVERFFRGGGEVAKIPRSLRADPPRRPENNYGRGSI